MSSYLSRSAMPPRHQQRGHRKAVAQGLRGGDHVRRDAVEIRGERRAGAAHAALHLIEYQQRAGVIAALPQCLQHGLADIVGAAHSLYGFDDDCGRIAVDELLDGGGFVARREPHVERRAREAVPFFQGAPGHRAGRRGAAVEALFERHDLAAARQLEGELQRIFVGLGAAVDPKHRVQSQACELRQARCGAFADDHGQRVGLKGHLARLALERRQPARMAVAQTRDRVAAVEIQNTCGRRARAARRPSPCATSMGYCANTCARWPVSAWLAAVI